MKISAKEDKSTFRTIKFEETKPGVVYKDIEGKFRWTAKNKEIYWSARPALSLTEEVEIRAHWPQQWTTLPMKEVEEPVELHIGSATVQLGEGTNPSGWRKMEFDDFEPGKVYMDRGGTLYWAEEVREDSQNYGVVVFLPFAGQAWETNPPVKLHMMSEDSWEPTREMREWKGQLTVTV
jgi:hypothetical protein